MKDIDQLKNLLNNFGIVYKEVPSIHRTTCTSIALNNRDNRIASENPKLYGYDDCTIYFDFNENGEFVIASMWDIE